jgi:hypothetical protein
MSTRVARWFILRPKIGYTLEGLAMEDVGGLFGHLVYFTAIWSILRPFGLFYGHLIYFMAIWHIMWQNFHPFWYIVTKNLATLMSTILVQSYG